MNINNTHSQQDLEFIFPGALNILHHEVLGYCAEIPAGMVEPFFKLAASQGLCCQLAPPEKITCAEDCATIVFGELNPFMLRRALEEEIAREVVVDTSRWPHGEKNYSDKVAAILRLKDPRQQKCNYAAKGITETHIPELVLAACDDGLYLCEEGHIFYWGTVHALLALETFARLPPGVARPLICQLSRIDDENDDWCADLVPKILAKIGEEAIPLLLAHYLNPTGHGAPVDEDEESQQRYMYSRNAACDAIKHIGLTFPESRGRCVRELASLLARHARQDTSLNGFIVCDLLDLKATEVFDIIEEAFLAGNVDHGILGDLEDARILFGLQKKRTTPKPWYNPLKLNLDNADCDDGGEDGDDDEFFDGPPLDPIRREAPKIGRNEPCPCGSGKKPLLSQRF